MKIFFLLSHGFFSERVFQLFLPTFSGPLWVLPLDWVFLLGNYLFLPRSSVCVSCSSKTSFSTNVSSSCFCPRNYQRPYFPLLALWGENLFSWLPVQNKGIKMSDSPWSLSCRTWQTLWENDGFTTCSNPGRSHFSYQQLHNFNQNS